MAPRRKPTIYSKIIDHRGGDDADDVELLSYQSSQHSVESSQWQGFDEIIETIRRELSLKSSTTSSTPLRKHISHDDVTRLLSHGVDPDKLRGTQQRFLSGWRFGALLSLIGAASVALFNTIITVWVWKNPKHEIQDSVGTLYRGSCKRAKSLDVWVHLLINVLSTLLLSASNYCMQVLSAPNWEELVRAHARKYWLHIGVPSFRNLFRIGKDRAFLWFLLVLSSVPLHLLFNSIVFTNLQANEYAVIPVKNDWITGAEYDTSGFIDVNQTETNNATRAIETYRLDFEEVQTSKAYERYSVDDCFDAYAEQYVSEAGNLYLVHDDAVVWRNPDMWIVRNGTFNLERLERLDDNVQNETAGWHRNSSQDHLPYLSTPVFYPSNGWRCASRQIQKCDVANTNEVPRDKTQWAPYGKPVSYCLVENVDELCKLQFSFPIAIAVIASNLVKALCMGLTLIWYRKHAALVTLGDTIANFLDHPDPNTGGRCLHTRRLMEAEWNWEAANHSRRDELRIEPEVFTPKRERWGAAPSGGRWLATYILYIAAIMCGFVFIARSLVGMPRDPAGLWNIGFGSLKGNNLLNLPTSLMGGVLLANLPQAVLSYLYLAFNALYTNMFVAREWSTYMTEHKPLRVTSPLGEQRETYWLNVPFRYAIPMTGVSGLFHWLASQSIFMVQISVTDHRSRKITGQISTCGYSPFAIIFTTVVGSVIALGGIIMARLRYPAGMPIAGSCSAAISAACHPPPKDVDASILPVQWGAVSHGGPVGASGRAAVGHCTFTSVPVEFPIEGRLYA